MFIIYSYFAFKALYPQIHSAPHGGDTKSTFKKYELPVVQQVLLSYLEENPTAKRDHLRRHLAFVFSRSVSLTVFSRLTKSLCWSWKIPTTFQIQKYRVDNIIRYLHYVSEVLYRNAFLNLPVQIQKIDPAHLKFCDEAHVMSKDLGCRRVLGLRSHRVYLKENTLHCARGSITILTATTGMMQEQYPIVFTFFRESSLFGL